MITSLALALLISLPVTAQTTSTRTGWIMFDDSIATQLELRDSQLERLKGIDSRYQSDYKRLGDDPRSDPNYLALTERRNAEIQTVLEPEQFEKWMRLNDHDYDNSRRRAEPGPADSNMDRKNPRADEFERDSRSNSGTTDPKSGVGTGTGTDGTGGPR